MKNGKKSLTLLLSLLFAFSFASCGTTENGSSDTGSESSNTSSDTGKDSESDTESGSSEEKTLVKNLIKDEKFQNGFKLYTPSETNIGFHSGAFLGSTPDDTPIWTMAQWAAKYDLINAKVTSAFGERSATITETTPPEKKIVVNTNTGSFSICLNTEADYDHDRLDGESWPHLLIGQDWFGSDIIRLVDMDYINMNITYKVTKVEDKSYGVADPSRHCCQFVWYVTLQNRNLDSPDYGSYVWFGLNLYDNRDDGKATVGFAAQDGGKEFNTGAFIYHPASTVWQSNGKTPTLNEKRAVSFNILDEAKKAFDLAKERHFLGNTKFEDLYIGSTNLGLEITGTYNMEVEMSGISILYEEKENRPTTQRYQ